MERCEKVGSGIVNGFKSFFGIHSPSRLMADEIGAYLPAGIDEGMKGAMPALLSSAKDQMGDLVDTVKAGTAEADGTLADSDTPLLSEVSGKVDIVEGMDNVLTQFSDKVADSFTNLLDRLTEITQNAGFSIPALATGTVTPYSVEGGKNSSSGGVLEKFRRRTTRRPAPSFRPLAARRIASAQLLSSTAERRSTSMQTVSHSTPWTISTARPGCLARRRC